MPPRSDRTLRTFCVASMNLANFAFPPIRARLAGCPAAAAYASRTGAADRCAEPGMRTRIRAPPSSDSSTAMVPPWRAMTCLTIASPNP